MTQLKAFPVLSLAVEKEIFEHCTRDRPTQVPKLMRVAQRVKERVEPFLYRTIHLSTPGSTWATRENSKPIDGYPKLTIDTLLAAIKSKPAAFFEKAVNNLLVVDTYGCEAVLGACTGIENLWIRDLCIRNPTDVKRNISLVPFMERLRLKHLYADPTPLLRANSLSAPLFSELTHLELLTDYAPQGNGSWPELSLLPKLTHLSFSSPHLFTTCFDVLNASKSLSVVVLLLPPPTSNIEYSDPCLLWIDPRFVMIKGPFAFGPALQDWQMGAHSGRDYWARADEMIAKRRLRQEIPTSEARSRKLEASVQERLEGDGGSV
ncbi:hypothetical protein C8R43DRAFT_991770 [Mycena crocata]|nr:hypothetical protein C8R43DRAFT_991770 [Mycena crocata]